MSRDICPGWEYKSFPSAPEKLRQRADEAMKQTGVPGFDTPRYASDTRPLHKSFFKGLTPALNPEYAGNYRGSAVSACIREYCVGVGGDPRVGLAPGLVAGAMEQVAGNIRDGIAALDEASQSGLPREKLLLLCVEFVAFVFCNFLTVHPYADGNGHMARYILWSVLARFGFRTKDFTIEPRPSEPNYGSYIARYRSGRKGPLEEWILSCFKAPMAKPGG